MPVDKNLLTYYSQRLIVQYITQEKMVETVQLLASCSLCEGLPQELQTCFDLETAIGAQLTILGKIVGVPRNVYGLDLEHTFFNFTNYVGSPASIGFGSYTDNPYPTDLFLSYYDSATYTLTDFELRNLIKIKIILNNIYSSTKNITESLWNLFGYSVIFKDNKDMSISYTVVDPYQTVFIAGDFLDILPRPMGVSMDLVLESALLTDESGNVLTDENGYPLYQE